MIGTKLKSARHNLRFNQEEMAHQLNTIRSSVSQWESDKSDPTLKKFVEVCNILKISPNEMLGWGEK
jgi:transcriptional regulator with XRE-family HTH domain